MTNWCEQSHCDFIVTTRDNFYDDGVSSSNDKHFLPPGKMSVLIVKSIVSCGTPGIMVFNLWTVKRGHQAILEQINTLY